MSTVNETLRQELIQLNFKKKQFLKKDFAPIMLSMVFIFISTNGIYSMSGSGEYQAEDTFEDVFSQMLFGILNFYIIFRVGVLFLDGSRKVKENLGKKGYFAIFLTPVAYSFGFQVYQIVQDCLHNQYIKDIVMLSIFLVTSFIITWSIMLTNT
ncbi:hypothetical protein FGO68_gene633 [Halteria grandinella]|uniref:Uncharacterized protein n=1 Tax=Halteria grandinella TaxID=5974 RepID=A0A8J8NM80_HALGN|nr:hypothetical protein FGO68_gene633 [Halteria grandinella]